MGKIGEIIGEGFIAGLLFGVALKDKVPTDEAGIYIMVLKEVCNITENNQFNCGGFIFLMGFLAIVITIISIFTAITKMKDWRVGAGIYGISFFIGFLLIIKN